MFRTQLQKKQKLMCVCACVRALRWLCIAWLMYDLVVVNPIRQLSQIRPAFLLSQFMTHPNERHVICVNLMVKA